MFSSKLSNEDAQNATSQQRLWEKILLLLKHLRIQYLKQNYYTKKSKEPKILEKEWKFVFFNSSEKCPVYLSSVTLQ